MTNRLACMRSAKMQLPSGHRPGRDTVNPRGFGQGTITVTWPGTVTLITPAQVHMHLQLLSSVGILPSITVGAPGIHGATVSGIQGMGVSTPMAAAVAEATTGLARLMHIPNGMMFSIGTKSMIFAAGMPPAIVRLIGSTI